MIDEPTDPLDAVEPDTVPATGEPAGAGDDVRPPNEPDHTDEDLDQVDLDRIERDLAGVEAALRRLDDGTYWTDEVTGEPIPDDVLAADPVARRAG